MAVNHLCIRIENALEHTDNDLMEIFMGSTTCKDGAEIREHLEARLAYGDIYLGAVGCVGFNPRTGCPGHDPKDLVQELPITASIAIRELEAKKRELSSTLISDMAKKAAYQDAINTIRDVYERRSEVAHG